MPEMDLRQIDALVAEKVMGRKVNFAHAAKDGGLVVYTADRDWLEPGTPYVDDGRGLVWAVPAYSMSSVTAQIVLDILHVAWRYTITNDTPNDMWRVTLKNRTTGQEVVAEAETDALAICLAALSAVGVEVPEDA